MELVQLDVTNDEEVTNAVNRIIDAEGRIDVLVNNAGYGVSGPAETVTIEQAEKMFGVNVFGLLRVSQAVLPQMRKQGSGRIVNISSIAGIRAGANSDIYNASKFAVEGLTEAMAPPLALAGIKLVMIEPGPVSTEFLKDSMDYGKKFQDVEIYKKTKEVMGKMREERFKDAQTAEEIAEVINKAITAENPHLRYQTSDWVKEAAKTKLRGLGD